MDKETPLPEGVWVDDTGDSDPEDLNQGRVIGSYECIPDCGVLGIEEEINRRGLESCTIKHKAGYDVMFFERRTPEIEELIILRKRSLGTLGPPLSLEEHDKLGIGYGVSKPERDKFLRELEKKANQVIEGDPSKTEPETTTGVEHPPQEEHPDPGEISLGERIDRYVDQLVEEEEARLRKAKKD